MKFLRTAFEEQLIAEIDDEGNVIVSDVPYSPVQILQFDQLAYDEAYQVWLSNEWLPEQEETLQSILKLYENKGRFEDLCNEIRKENVVPFIGSGM